MRHDIKPKLGMHSRLRQFIFCCISFSLPVISLWGQPYNYVFIQSSDRTAFYVRYNDQLHHSSASGFLYLTRLKQGDVFFRVGKTESLAMGQDILIKSLQRNSGFLLTKNDSDGWGLTDLKDANKTYSGVPVSTGEDPFGTLLAKVTQDSTVMSLGANEGGGQKKKERGVAVKSAVRQVSRTKSAKRYEYIFEVEGHEGRDTIQLIIERGNLKP